MSDSTTAGPPRFWSRREGRFRLDPFGFLLDPEGPFRKSLNPELTRLADEAGRDCLVLLGEPGMGKSTELGAENRRRERAAGPSDDVAIWADLGEYGDETRLIRDLFETAEWDLWREGARTLHLYLDALDECRLHLPNVTAVVLGRLGKLPRRDRLKLRVACRTGAWPHLLEEGLMRLWPGDRLGVFELAPLRRRDVAESAAAAGLEDIEEFLREVERRDAGPLAAKPVTLRLLLNLCKRGGLLPRTQKGLYERGCRALCEETNDSRLAAGRHGVLGVEERLAVASRVAAAMVFCGRSAVWHGPDLADRPDDDIAVPELSGGTEAVQGVDFAVTEAGIREVLSDTGLFSSRGPKRVGWAHRTFAEFLAARHLVARGLSVEQVKGLVLHPRPPGRVVPQLHQATAWLAGMVPGVFRIVLECDPGVLLGGDVENATADDREALVAALLKAAFEDRLGEVGFDARSEFRKLKHPGLAVQLDPVLKEKSGKLAVRRLAIEIGQACEVRDLQGRLTDLALDRSEDMTIRVDAGYAVGSIGDEPTRRRMKPLLAADLVEDTHDQLKGCALKSLWPGLIPAEEVFRAVTVPKRENWHGAYSGFLASDLVRGLELTDLPVALEWAMRQGDPRLLPYIVGLVVDQVVVRAWDEIDAPEIAEPLAAIVWSRIEAHAKVTGRTGDDRFGADAGKRRKLLRALVPKLSHSAVEAVRLCYASPPLATAEDSLWLIGLLDLEGDPATRVSLARLARETFLQSAPRPIDEMLAAAGHHEELAEAIRDLITPVALDSPEAGGARESRALWLSHTRRSQTEPMPAPPRAETIERLLRRDEGGDPDAWWQLTLAMTLEPTSGHSHDTFRSDLTALPGWREADAGTRSRVLNAAHRYVVSCRPSPDEWFFREGATYLPDEAAFKAFRLLRERAEDRFEALGPEVWRKWVPALVGYFAFGRPDDEMAQSRLAGQAYRNAPKEVLAWIGKWLAEQDRRDYPVITARLWADIPGAALNGVLMERVTDRSTKVWVMETLLNDLLARGVAEAREFATSLLGLPLPEVAGRRERSLASARSLLTRAPDAGWAAIRPALLAAPAFGRELVESIAPSAGRPGSAPFLARLTEADVADFYVWLARHFPHREDEAHEGFHAVGAREFVARLRDGVLRHLSRSGTAASLEALDTAARELSHLPWLSSVRLEAETVVMERTWVPHRLEDLRALAGDGKVRLVEGGDQLLVVVMESLARFERKLQGETPASFMLWDKNAKSRFRPKEEERLSDALKLHLEGDLAGRGVVANREVVVRSGLGGEAGERTDIHVDAITSGRRPGAFDAVTVVVEVKGCWNRDVLTAMRDQLRDRYLRDGGCRHGLYVVCWSLCDLWDAEDYRKDDARRQLPPSLAEARALFAGQASELSDGSAKVVSSVVDISLR